MASRTVRPSCGPQPFAQEARQTNFRYQVPIAADSREIVYGESMPTY